MYCLFLFVFLFVRRMAIVQMIDKFVRTKKKERERERQKTKDKNKNKNKTKNNNTNKECVSADSELSKN